MQTKILGNSDLEISAMGLGLMGMSPSVYGASNDEESIQVIHKAMDLGVTLFDTADTYGNGHNEQLLAKALGNKRQKVTIATKFGYGENWQYVGGKPEYVKAAAEASLKRLDTDYIDLYYFHAIDPNTPIEETVGAMSDLVKEGKVRYIGLSNGVTPEILKKANKIHPISALQTEYNLWTREDESTLLPLAKELGISHVAYAPLSRGFISGDLRTFDDLDATDIRRHLPRFQPNVFQQNVDIVDMLKEIAKEKGVTAAQLAIAWTMANGAIPIPGTKHINYLEENLKSLDIEMTNEDIQRLNEVTEKYEVQGNNY